MCFLLINSLLLLVLKVKIKLEGHQKRVTGLAFSNVLNVLVSSGADAQVCCYALCTLEVKNNQETT